MEKLTELSYLLRSNFGLLILGMGALKGDIWWLGLIAAVIQGYIDKLKLCFRQVPRIYRAGVALRKNIDSIQLINFPIPSFLLND
ncbi:unnamed protein product [Coffea canephora]|uniref:Uncharacterized protein n=1 Tax=Coffea canephora TaxID=49390 RepID=A0A068UJ62_COFCA|nr:unnamed protein product [Coffea canephora]